MNGLICVFLLSVGIASTFGSSLREHVKQIPEFGQIADADPGQFNYQVGLYIRNGNLKNWCGGSLISPEWILTSARCVHNAENITAYLGSIKKKSGIEVDILQTIIHERYNEKTQWRDIALLRIAPVSLGPNINTVKLPALQDHVALYPHYINENAFASGWGNINDGGNSVNNLQYAILEVYGNDLCRTYPYHNEYYTMENLCAMAPGTPKNITCHGYAGGPLVTELTQTLIGVMSFDPKVGCTFGMPNIFTRITSYRPWILEKTGV